MSGKVYRVTLDIHVPSYVKDEDLLDNLQTAACEEGADITMDDVELLGDSDEVD